MTVTTIRDVVSQLERLAPLELAESWDNVGLLAGDWQAPVERLMTCLTITPETADEAIAGRVQMVVTHHPLPFRPMSRLTSDSTPGRLLLSLLQHGVAIYSAHTAFDSAAGGINQQLAAGLQLTRISALLPRDADSGPVGAGRQGVLERDTTLSQVNMAVKSFLPVVRTRVVGDLERKVRRVAVACGSGGSFIMPAVRQQCDLLVTGEASFHDCLAAAADGLGLILTGHYASERFACETLAVELRTCLPEIETWASSCERDPLVWC